MQLDNDLSLNDLIIEAGNELNVKPGFNLTVNNDLHNFAGSGNFVLESDNTATASLIHHTDNVPATLQRYIAGSANTTTTQYHQVSVPLTQASNPTAALFWNAYLMHWNPVLDEWQWITDPNEVLDVDIGYMIWYTGTETTIDFEGSLNNGSFTAGVPSNATGQHSLVPNPYPSAIDWDAATGWTKTNLDDAVYIWSRENNNYMGYGNDQAINGGSRYIAAGQAFVVAANDAAASLQMNNDVRLHNPIPFRDNTDETDVLRIAANGTYGSDELVIRLHENASPNFDGHADLRKMFGGANAPQLYARTADTELLSVYSLPYSDQVQTVEIGFEMATEDEPLLHFSGVESFESSATLMLEDRYTQRMYDLRDQQSLSITHDPSGNGIRFLLHLYGPTSLEDYSAASQSRIWQSGDWLYIDTPERVGEMAVISLHDALGRTLKQTEMRMESPTVLNMANHRGVVIVSISTAEGSETHKVVIQ